MNDALARWAAHLQPGGTNLKALDPWEADRFQQLGIDQAMANRIALQLKIHKTDFKSDTPATTETWKDDVARVARRYVPGTDAAVVVVGPAGTIAPQLESLGPFERTDPVSCTAPGGPSATR